VTPTASPDPEQTAIQAADPADLLVWYDRHRRSLPWRAMPGERADPYRVWLSEIMLQQTTVQAVKPYFERFLTRFPDVESLANAPQDAVMQAWAGLGYYSRARNLHACAKVVARDHGGRFPADEVALRALPGIGAYTAAAIAAIAFDIPAAAVDGNVERVVSRLIALEEPLPAAKPRIRSVTQDLVPEARAGDFAQAMMDLGATICTPKRPACALCPWMEACAARREGLQESFPRKLKKAPREVRYGAAFVAERADGRDPAPHAPLERPARRDGRGAGQRLASGLPAEPGHPRRAFRGALAASAGHCAPCLHAFSAGTDRVPRPARQAGASA
jgi:A/G-specific adenine glycosylase